MKVRIQILDKVRLAWGKSELLNVKETLEYFSNNLELGFIKVA